MTYYHGTNLNGVLGIAKDSKIGHAYGDGVGVFLSDNIEISLNFGQYVLIIEGIDESKLETDDVNDGFFHRGFIDSKFIKNIHTEFLKDARVVKDINEYYSE